MSSRTRRRYAVAGVGHRAGMYVDAVLGQHADVAELVAWCDSNPGRMDYYDERVVAAGGGGWPRYGPEGPEQMVGGGGVDAGIVTSPEYTHADVVSRASLAGVEVIEEQPLTIDASGFQRVASAVDD